MARSRIREPGTSGAGSRAFLAACRGTDADDHAPQDLDVGREAAQQRPGAENRNPGEHDTLAAELVTHHAERQHGGGEDQRVGADHSLLTTHCK